MEKESINLGCINGWISDKEIYLKCKKDREAGNAHEMVYTKIGRGQEQVECKTCGYFYCVDSGD